MKTTEKLIPQLRFSEFKKENYSLVKFGSVIKNSGYGPRFNGNDYDLFGNVKTIRGTDISLEGEIEYSQVPIAKLDESVIRNHILEDGDLVMITTADCGLTGVFRQQNINYIPSAYAVKIGLKDKASPIYFKYFFQTTIAKNQINRFVRKATVANLPGSDIPRLNVNIPQLPEQQKIAAFLTCVDAKITQLTKKKTLLEQYKKGVMQQLFNQELRFKDDDGNNFADWEEKKLGKIGSIVSGLTYSPNDIDENGVLVLRSSNVKKRLVSLKDNVFVNVEEGKFNPVKLNDILICVRNGSKRLIGKNAIIKEEHVGLAFGAFMTVYRSAYNQFLFHFFDSKHYKKEVHKNLGATINSINGSDLKRFVVPFPCLKEQTKIANFLSEIDVQLEALNTKIENSKTFKKGLLQKMFV